MQEIEFSKDGKGTILTRVQNNRLYFEQITDGDVNIGELTEVVETTPLVELNFYKIESVDAVIEQLNKVKANLTMLSAC